MKPVLIFRHAKTEGPGHFATFLDRLRIPWQPVKLDEGEGVPSSSSPYAGLAFMGGPMSANDDHLPWTQPVLALIRDAVERRVPVIGHCLGGQLLARALGARVTSAPTREIGWQLARVEPVASAREWFGGDLSEFITFQWHQESFAIPPGGERILTSPWCANQAYVVDGRHLGMQCHVEMTEEMIRSWCSTGASEVEEARGGPAVQPVEAMLAEMGRRLPVLNSVAERLYSRWVRGLAGRDDPAGAAQPAPQR